VQSFVRIVRLAAALVVVSQLGAGVAAAQGTDLSVEKWVFGPGGPVAADAPFVYSIFVFNNGLDEGLGGEDAHDVVVTDVLPPGVTFEYATVSPEGSTCTLDVPSNTVTCNLGDVVLFDGVFIDLGVRAPSFAGPIVNTATVAASTADPIPDNNSASVSADVVVFNLSDLAVTTTASAAAVLVHRAVTFTTTVTNLGPQDATSVSLSLVPPSNADITSLTPSQGTCAIDELGNYECLLGPLAAGDTATVTMVVKPQKDGFALVSAFVSGSDDPLFFDPDFLNDFDSAVVDVSYPGNANPAYPVTTSQVVPYETYVFNPCTEEVIYLSGYVHQVVSSTFNNNRFRTNAYTNFGGLTGVGLSSGTTYEVSGASRTGTGLSLVFNGLWPREVTTVDRFLLVGGGQTLVLHQNTHFTINADGSFTSNVDNPSLECK
jgi:uncharacterized repeat protein (TIGR01451 family)